MFDYLYEWIRNIAFYMILVMVVIQILPNTEYKKYIRFFTGLVLILLMAGPVLKIFGMDQTLSQVFNSREYEAKIQNIEDSTKYLQDIDVSPYLDEAGQEDETEGIGVEEVQIGE